MNKRMLKNIYIKKRNDKSTISEVAKIVARLLVIYGFCVVLVIQMKHFLFLETKKKVI